MILSIRIGFDSEIRPIEAPRTIAVTEKKSEVTLFTGHGEVNLDKFPSFKKLFNDLRNNNL